MTKEKLLKKRKRDIGLVVLFGILIVVFIVATIVTFSFQDEERVWITLLGVFFFILVIFSIGFTAFFGMHINEENEKLHLIQKGVPEEDVEEKYKEIQEAKQNGTYTEEEQDESGKKQKVTTLADLKKNKKIFYILTIIFGILTGVAFIIYFATYSGDDEEEISNIISVVGTTSGILFVLFLIALCIFASQLHTWQKKIDLVEKNGIPADQVDEYLSELEEREKYIRERTKQDKKDKKKAKKCNHYSVFDDHHWEHDVFNDPDIKDDDIMDFMDDDY